MNHFWLVLLSLTARGAFGASPASLENASQAAWVLGNVPTGETPEEAWLRGERGELALSGLALGENGDTTVRTQPSGASEPPPLERPKKEPKDKKDDRRPRESTALEKLATAVPVALATAQAGKMSVNIVGYIVGGFIGLATGGLSGIPAQAQFVGPLAGWIGAVAGFALGFYFAWVKDKSIRKIIQDFFRDRRKEDGAS